MSPPRLTAVAAHHGTGGSGAPAPRGHGGGNNGLDSPAARGSRLLSRLSERGAGERRRACSRSATSPGSAWCRCRRCATTPTSGCWSRRPSIPPRGTATTPRRNCTWSTASWPSRNSGCPWRRSGRSWARASSVGEFRGMLRLKRAEAAQRVAEEQERLERVEARLHLIEKEGRMPEQEVVVKSVPEVRGLGMRDKVAGPPGIGGVLRGRVRRPGHGRGDARRAAADGLPRPRVLARVDRRRAGLPGGRRG